MSRRGKGVGLKSHSEKKYGVICVALKGAPTSWRSLYCLASVTAGFALKCRRELRRELRREGGCVLREDRSEGREGGCVLREDRRELLLREDRRADKNSSLFSES